jgi:DNA-binding NarL/FixJ family response regulator
MADQTPIANSSLISPLSKREMEIMQLLASGATNKEIAARLYITEGTVKNHITDIFKKLGVSDRMNAGLKAKNLGLI